MIEKLLNLIATASSESEALKTIPRFAAEITQLDDDAVDHLVAQMAQLSVSDQLTPLPDADGTWKTRLELIIPVSQSLLVRELKQIKDAQPGDQRALVWSAGRLRNFETLYLAVAPDAQLPNHLLRWLATGHDTDRLQLWVQLMGDQPPEDRTGIALSFAPLMDVQFQPPDWFLDALIDSPTRHSQVAAAVYDLCNFYYRHGRVSSHPAEPRLERLNGLLEQLCSSLLQIESGKVNSQIDARAINRQVADSVALIVALCDVFALLEYQTAADNIIKVMMLRHRRVQTEAAAALAKMGYDQGRTALIAMAQDPVSRLRVLAYAEELGFLDQVSLELQGEISIAESQLAIWLSEPQQMGLAPTHIELVDNREMYWPSYEHPVQCFLFRYRYGSGENAYSNVGICGPLSHAFAADIRHLAPEDCYALFAGWQTTHQEIFQIAVERAAQLHPSEIRRLQSLLSEQQVEEQQIQTAAGFFGETILIATGKIDGVTGTAIVDQAEVTWIPSGAARAPIDWDLASALWRGRRLLTTFNHQDRV